MSATDCRECLTALLEYACQPEFSSQMHIARELFFLATGKVNDEDPFYEARMASFLEYFTFEYRLAESYSGATILELFLLNGQNSLNAPSLMKYESFRSLQHSLFLIEKSKAEALAVIDLFSGVVHHVRCLPDFRFDGFEPGLVFEGRLLSFEGERFFTTGFVFHPKEVAPLIVKSVRTYLHRYLTQKRWLDADWRQELKRRHDLLAEIAEQKKETQIAEKKRAIDYLKVTKQLVHVSRDISSPSLVMALGRQEEVSPFVPESPFLDLESFLQRLAYCQVKSHRYKHIDPMKVYDLSAEFGVVSKPPTFAAAKGEQDSNGLVQDQTSAPPEPRPTASAS
jgi:hypothetical protein